MQFGQSTVPALHEPVGVAHGTRVPAPRRHRSPALPVCVPDLQDAGAQRHIKEKFAYCISLEDFRKEFPNSESKHIYMDANDYNHFYYTRCQGCRELKDEYNALVKAQRDGTRPSWHSASRGARPRSRSGTSRPHPMRS